MAKFDQRLPLTDGTNRVIDDPATPSFVGAVADFATQALTGYMNIRDEEASKKAKAKAEEEKQKQANIAYEVSGANDRATSAVASSRQQFLQSLPEASPQVLQVETSPLDPEGNAVFDVTATPTTAVQREMDAAAQRASSFKAAVDQGRLPGITFNSAMNADFRRLRDKYPDQVEYILKTYKSFGIDANLFTEAKDAQDEHEFVREQGQSSRDDSRKREEAYIGTAEAALGPMAKTLSREQLITQGMQFQKEMHDLKLLEDRARVTKAKVELSEAERKTAQTDLDQRIEQTISGGVYNASQPFIESMRQLTNGLMTNPNDPDLVQRFQNLGVEAKFGITNHVEASVQAAVQSGYTGNTETLRKNLTARWQPVLDLFQGDFSVVNAKMSSLKSIETSLKIDTATSLPLFTSLKGAGFDVANLPEVMKAVESDPKLMKELQNELKGYKEDLMDDGGSARFRRIIGILRGEQSLRQMPPGEAAQIIPTLVTSSMNLAKSYIREPDRIDPDLVINGIGEISTNIRNLGPSNSVAVFSAGTAGFALPEHRQALIKALDDGRTDRGMVLATIQASRAASAQMLNYYQANLGNVNRTTELFKVTWDERDGKYKIDRSGLNKAIQRYKKGQVYQPTGSQFGPMTSIGDSVTLRNLQNAQIPKDMEQFIKGANLNLDNAIELGRHDPSTPPAKDIELRNWYGMDRPLSVAEGNKSKADPQKELESMFSRAEEAIDQLSQDVSTNRVRPVSSAPAEIKQAIEVKAAEHGIPQALAEALISKESSFNPSAQGPIIKDGTHKGDRAMGLGQVMAKTAAKYGVTDRASLNAEGQLDLAFRVLKDNYKASGNWKDAVSMYFSGVPFARAVREGRSDGFNDIIQYVEDIIK